jgi:Domain of unknown function (DUF4407)
MKIDWRAVFRRICHVMRCDPDIMAKAPIWDRSVLVGEAAFLSLVALISGIAWTNFWLTFIAWPFALLFGGIAFAFIALMDIAIGAADWRLEGILRRPGIRYRSDWWFRLGLRVLVSIVFSLATAEGACQAMFYDAILQQLETDMLESNRATEDRFAKRETELRQQRLGTWLGEITGLQSVVKQTTGPLDSALQNQATAQNHLDAAEREVDRQRRGLDGYAKGCGPKCHAAIIDSDKARAELAQAKAQVAIYKPRVDDAKTKLDGAKQALGAAEDGIRSDISALEAEKKSQLVTVHSDPLLNHMALEELFQDPRKGEAAREFSWLMKLLLITLEMSYLMVRIFFAHASVYRAMLIADTKLRAEREDADYRRKLEALRGRAEPPAILPPVKLISWDDPAAKPGNDDAEVDRRDPPDDDLEAAD